MPQPCPSLDHIVRTPSHTLAATFWTGTAQNLLHRVQALRRLGNPTCPRCAQRAPSQKPLRPAPEAKLRSPCDPLGSAAPSAGAAFDPARPVFEAARPGLYVCHCSERPKILRAHACTEYRGMFRSIAHALTKAQPSTWST